MVDSEGFDPCDTSAIHGAQLRAAREAAGMSLAQLAKQIPYSRSTLGLYETGVRIPTPEVTLWYERSCGARFNPVSALRVLGRADVDRRSFLRRVGYSVALSATALADLPEAARLVAVTSSYRVGMPEVQAMRTVTAAFLKLDEARGGQIGRTAVAEFLTTDVAGMLSARFDNETTRMHAFSAAAELAYLAGFKAHDAGDDGVAQRYYLSALRLAEEAGTPAHDAFALRILALQGVDIRRRQASVDLAEEAVRRSRGHVGADTAALFQVALARCHAESGNKREALAVLRSAEPAITPEVTSDIPRWAAMWCTNKANVIDQTAKTFSALGEHAEADRHSRLSATIWNPETHARVYALACADAGLSRWRMGDDTGAVDRWRPIIPVLQSVQSVRTAKALTNIGKYVPELVTRLSHFWCESGWAGVGGCYRGCLVATARRVDLAGLVGGASAVHVTALP